LQVADPLLKCLAVGPEPFQAGILDRSSECSCADGKRLRVQLAPVPFIKCGRVAGRLAAV